MKKLITILFAVALGLNLSAQTACPPAQDANQDGVIGVDDLMDLLSHWGDTDFDFDGVYDSVDLCTDEGACNYLSNPTESCLYLDAIGACGGDCAEDTDGDGVCDEFYGPCQGESTVTYHGYTYDLVAIGEQCWFAENLRTEYYANGDPIPSDIQDSLLWATAGAQTYFSEDSVFLEERGRMYNGHAVLDARGLCPTGWHVPSDGDFIQLEGATGMSEVDWESTAEDRGCSLEIGGAWKSQSGWYPGDEGTDLWGLSVQPSGYFVAWEGFGNAYTNSEFWTSTPYDATQLWRRQVPADSGCLFRGEGQMVVGSAIRCIKDTE